MLSTRTKCLVIYVPKCSILSRNLFKSSAFLNCAYVYKILNIVPEVDTKIQPIMAFRPTVRGAYITDIYQLLRTDKKEKQQIILRVRKASQFFEASSR